MKSKKLFSILINTYVAPGIARNCSKHLINGNSVNTHNNTFEINTVIISIYSDLSKFTQPASCGSWGPGPGRLASEATLLTTAIHWLHYTHFVHFQF